MRSISVLMLAAALACPVQTAKAEPDTPLLPGTTGSYSTPYPHLSESGLLTPTHHHRLGQQTMFGASTLQTQASTVEETAPQLYTPTSRLAVPWMPPAPARAAQVFPTFSRSMLAPTVLPPTVSSPPNVMRLASPGMSLGGIWPAGDTLHVNEGDLEQFGGIEWGHGGEQGPFSLEHLMP